MNSNCNPILYYFRCTAKYQLKIVKLLVNLHFIAFASKMTRHMVIKVRYV